jgi:succinoglycan biosynthesis protein ExoA
VTADGAATAAATPQPAPFASVILPALNEERYLERCVRSLLDGSYPLGRLEVFVVDGGSTDRTVEIAERLKAEFPCLAVLHNPQRLQAAAFNLAMRAADRRSRYLIRCDVHADYEPGFIGRAIASLAATPGAAVSTYADAPKALSCFQRAVAFAQNTPLGVGAAWYRLGGQSRFVDHGKHGCFRRDAVEAVGGYDENFSHNEDSELSLRLAQAGWKIWLDAGLTVGYYPRDGVRALARQYYLYGRGRAKTVMKHRLMPRPRQLAPAALVAGEAALLLASLAVQPWLLPACLALYAACLAAVAGYGALRKGSACVLLAAIAFAVMHHCWGLGFLMGLAGGGGRQQVPPPRRPRSRAVASADAPP